MSQKTSWKYEAKDKVASNPTSLGETLKSTTAKVDKVNKQIDLVTSKADANSSSIAALELNTDSIVASVKSIEENTAISLDNINDNLQTLTNEVETKVSAEQVSFAINSELAKGTDKVTTSTGFTFDENGLTVSKSGSEIKTQITEDGMSVYKNEEKVLTANNIGVQAMNLHATTYLIIGNNSRFEDYTNIDGESRTGCFWIGN